MGAAEHALEAHGARRSRNASFFSAPQLKRDSLGAMRATLPLLSWLTVCSVGCHPGSRTAEPCYFGHNVPQVGSNTRLEITRASRSDSLLTSASVGQVVTRIRWSSDSLASLSRPEGVVLDLMQLRTHARTTEYFGRDALLTQGFLERVLRVPAGEYGLRIRFIATASFDTTVTVRRGFSDTALVYLQRGGTRICY